MAGSFHRHGRGGMGNVGHHPTPQDSSFLVIHVSQLMFFAVIYIEHFCNAQILSLRYFICHVNWKDICKVLKLLKSFFHLSEEIGQA